MYIPKKILNCLINDIKPNGVEWGCEGCKYEKKCDKIMDYASSSDEEDDVVDE